MNIYKVFGSWNGEWADARLEKAGTPRDGEDFKIPLERLFLFQCYVEGACYKSLHIVEASCKAEAEAKLKGEAWDGLDGSLSLDEFEEYESAQ